MAFLAREVHSLACSNRLHHPMIQDFRSALRLIRNAPGFALLAILSLAAAIGVNSGIYAIIDGALLSPVIKDGPGEAVNMFTARKNAESDFREFSYAEYRTLAAPNEVFSDLGAFRPTLVGVGTGDVVRRSFAYLADDGYFRIQATQPAMGRTFSAAESRIDAAIPVVVLSDSLWHRLGARADVVGSTVRVTGQPLTVIGVMPRGFSGGSAVLGPELWLPFGMRVAMPSIMDNGLQLSDPRSYTLDLIGRLKPGLTPDAAASRLGVLAARLDAVKADASQGPRTLVIERPPRFSISSKPAVEAGLGAIPALMLGLSGAVLLIACLNLANLMLALGTARAREFAVRLAIGASRAVLVRQLLIEALVLSLLGGAVGLVLADWGCALLIRSIGGALGTLHFAITLQIQPNLRIIGATFAFCTLATLIFALVPALRAARADIVHDLKRQSGDSRDAHSLIRLFAPRQVLVMAQLALSLMLLFAAGLFFRAALAAAAVSPGFDSTGDLVAEFDYSLVNIPHAQTLGRVRAVLERSKGLPGVQRAAIATDVPYGLFSDSNEVGVAGALGADGKPVSLQAFRTGISDGYFGTVGVRVLSGRDFSAAEVYGQRHVAIIDETLAEKLFPRANPLGRQVQLAGPEGDGSRPKYEIVGIVAAHREDIISPGFPMRIFLPLGQDFNDIGFLHLKVGQADEAALAAMLPSFRSELRGMDSQFPLLSVQTFADIVAANIGLWAVRLGAILLGLFGGIALLLAVGGVYGVRSYAVERRQREIGIRIAVGAGPGDVVRLFMAQGAAQIGVGLGMGLLLSLIAGRALSAMLYRVSPFDPSVLGFAIASLAVTAGLATWLPTRRAARVDPSITLRAD